MNELKQRPIDLGSTFNAVGRSLQDIQDWLKSLSSAGSSQYDIQSVIQHYCQILANERMDISTATAITNDVINVLSSYPACEDRSLMEPSLSVLCSYLDTERASVILYFIDCLFNLFPDLFPICIPFLIKSSGMKYICFVSEHLANPSLCTSESLGCFIQGIKSNISTIDFSVKETCFDFIDQIFILFESLHDYQDQFIPIVSNLFYLLESSHLLLEYMNDLSLSLHSSLLLFHSFQSSCKENADLNILLTLFSKYKLLYESTQPSVMLFYSYPMPSALFETILACCRTLLNSHAMHDFSYLLPFLHAQTIQYPLLTDVLREIISLPDKNAFKTQFVQRSVELGVEWRFTFITQHLREFFDQPFNENLFQSLMDAVALKSPLQEELHACFRFLFSLDCYSLTPSMMEHIQTSRILLQSSIPYFVQWSLQQVPSTAYQSLIEKMIEFYPLRLSQSLLESPSPLPDSLFMVIRTRFSQSIQNRLQSYLTPDKFALSQCISRNDFCVLLNPFVYYFTFEALFCQVNISPSWKRCATNTDWLQEESDCFRDDLFFPPKAFPSFVLLLCEMYYSIFFHDFSDVESLIFAMELECCLENREELTPFFIALFQPTYLQQLYQHLNHPVIVSFLVTHLELAFFREKTESLRIVCMIVISLSHSRFEVPSLTLEHLRPMKVIVKELAPRSLPSLKRKLSLSYLLNCFSSLVAGLLKNHRPLFSTVLQETETKSLDSWGQQVIKELSTKPSSSSLVTVLTQLIAHPTPLSFDLSEWYQPPALSDSYLNCMQGIQSNIPILQILEIFQLKAPASDRFLLLLSSLSSLEVSLATYSSSLSPDLVSFYQESSQKMRQIFQTSIQPYRHHCTHIQEFNAYTVISSLFLPLLECVRKDTNTIPDFVFSVLFLSLEAMLTSVFEIRSIQLQWIVNNISSYIEWCKEDTEDSLMRMSILPLIWNWCQETTLYVKYRRKITSELIQLRNLFTNKKVEDGEILSIIHYLPTKQRPPMTKKRNTKRMFNRNPAVNAMLDEEEIGVDNYEDLADFIDPTPDTSLQNVHFSF